MNQPGTYPITTLDEALAALEAAREDVQGDNPELDLQTVHYDLVDSVVLSCTDEVAERLRISQGLDPVAPYGLR